MPRKKPQIGRLTPGARRKRYLRSLEDDDKRQKRLLKFRMSQKVKKLGKALTLDSNKSDNEQSSGNFISVNVLEVTLTDIKSEVEDSDEQDEDDNSKQTSGKEKCKLISVSKLGTMRSEETCVSDGCLKKVKIEKTE